MKQASSHTQLYAIHAYCNDDKKGNRNENASNLQWIMRREIKCKSLVFCLQTWIYGDAKSPPTRTEDACSMNGVHVHANHSFFSPFIAVYSCLLLACIVLNRHIYTKHVSLDGKFQKLHLFQSTIPVIRYSLVRVFCCFYQLYLTFFDSHFFAIIRKLLIFLRFYRRRDRMLHWLVVAVASAFFLGIFTFFLHIFFYW